MIESPATVAAGSGETLIFPASIAQEAFWFLDQLEPRNSAFNVAVRFRLAGPLDVSVAGRALNEIVRRHEVLRTQLEQEDSGIVQAVLPAATLPLKLIDLSDLAGDALRDEIEKQGSSEAQEPFSLDRAPLIRASILKLHDHEHILQLTIHHAVSDGWSIGLITDEFGLLYEAFEAGHPSPLPPLPLQFGDFTVWQRDFLQGPEIASQLAYWKQRLAGQVEPDLPTDWPRPTVKRWSGDIVSLLLPVTLTSRLQAICHAHAATLFMAFLAGFKLLLSRYTGQLDISVGSPVTGRTRAEIEKLVGVFINTVILRTDLAGSLSFAQALRAVRETVVAAMANQDLPFETLVKELQPARTLGRNPLFQVNFIHQRDFVKPLAFGSLSLTAIPSRSPGAIFDLQFFMVERDGVWRASCEYNTGLFARDTALRMLGHFQQLLQAAVANPDLPFENLDLLPPAERRLLLREWQGGAVAGAGGESLSGRVAAVSRRAPGKAAVRCGGRVLTYGELDLAADAVAGQLASLGVGPGALVGLCVERSVDMVVGLLGILKAGAAYVPMDPAFPAERLGWMIEDAALPVIVTQTSLVEALPPHQARLICLDQPNVPLSSRAAPKHLSEGGRAAPEPLGEGGSSSADPEPGTRNPEPGTRTPRSDDLAYVIFTSGSTGRPKGVQISHRAVVNFLDSMRREPGLTPADVLLSVTTLSFDIAGLELFLPLTTGATVVIASRETAADGYLLRRELETSGATVMQATPVTWRLLLEAGWTGDPRLKILIGGEAVPRELVNQLAPRCGSLWNMYGPTETTIWSTTGRLEAGEGPVSIGRPIDNTQVYIVNRQLQLQPVGVPGELLIGGDGLAVGYLQRPELTAEKFIPNPFGAGRVYRTGDLAKWRADGTIECLGRLDQQVKIRGYRIELGEIEARLATHPDVKQAVVVAREDTPGDRRLVGYVVPSVGAAPAAGRLRDYLRGTLPEYMVPAAVVVLPELPVTPNGKINRLALPPPEGAATPDSNHLPIPPSSAEELRLAKLFGAILGTPIRSVTDSFFDLGGHSLSAVRLMAAIEREFQVRLPLARLLDSPSVSQLAIILAAPKSISEAWRSLVPIQPRPGVPTLFLVHGAGGNVLLYRELAAALAPDISVYGFQSQGLDRRSKPLSSVEEMAGHYLKELLELQPSGPYFLGGYCMGGSVAFEMARRLTERGNAVSLVALLDTYNLSQTRRPRGIGGRFSYLSQKAGFHLGSLARLGARDILGYLAEKLRMADEAGKGKILATIQGLKGAVGGAVDEPQAEAFIQEVNHEAAWRFVPQPFHGQVCLFRPQKNYDFYPDPKMGWGELVGESLQVVPLPVNPHAMLIEPFASRLATELRARIIKASALPDDSAGRNSRP